MGPDWVMVGDAFGFVDPMLSPGVYLALRSSELVADALTPLVRRAAVPSPAEIDAALRPYVLAHEHLLGAWTDLIGYFYGGQMMALMRAGQAFMHRRSGIAGRVAERHIERRVALLASGTDTTGRYSRTLLRFLTRHARRGVEPGSFAIR